MIPEFTFFDNYSGALLITNEEDSPVFVNSAFIRLTGMDLHEVLAAFPKGFSNSGKEVIFQKNGENVIATSTVSEMSFSDKSKGKVYTFTDMSELDELKNRVKETGLIVV